MQNDVGSEKRTMGRLGLEFESGLGRMKSSRHMVLAWYNGYASGPPLECKGRSI